MSEGRILGAFCAIVLIMLAFLAISMEREADARGRYFNECMERVNWTPEKTNACQNMAYHRARAGLRE